MHTPSQKVFCSAHPLAGGGAFEAMRGDAHSIVALPSASTCPARNLSRSMSCPRASIHPPPFWAAARWAASHRIKSCIRSAHIGRMECCSCGAKTPGGFPSWQRKQPVRHQRCRACVSRLLRATRTAWREDKIHRLHNASPNMMATFISLPAMEQQRIIRSAESHLNSWQETAAEHRRQTRLGGGFSSYTTATNPAFEVCEWSRLGALEDVENEVCIVRNVLSDAECDAVLEAIFHHTGMEAHPSESPA